MCNRMSFIVTREPFQLCRLIGEESHEQDERLDLDPKKVEQLMKAQGLKFTPKKEIYNV